MFTCKARNKLLEPGTQTKILVTIGTRNVGISVHPKQITLNVNGINSRHNVQLHVLQNCRPWGGQVLVVRVVSRGCVLLPATAFNDIVISTLVFCQRPLSHPPTTT